MRQFVYLVQVHFQEPEEPGLALIRGFSSAFWVGKIAVEVEKELGRVWCGIRLSVAFLYQLRYCYLV
jgi:hypothetical protein